jgi:hypothetical protein
MRGIQTRDLGGSGLRMALRGLVGADYMYLTISERRDSAVIHVFFSV